MTSTDILEGAAALILLSKRMQRSALKSKDGLVHLRKEDVLNAAMILEHSAHIIENLTDAIEHNDALFGVIPQPLKEGII